MRNFQLVAGGVDVGPLLFALARQPALWDANTIRTKHPGTAHADVSDILLRFNDVAEYQRTGDLKAIVDDSECITYPAWHALPQAHAIVFDLMRRVEGVRLGRVLITRLPPGKTITPHVDGGAPAIYYTRYMLALQSLPGAVFHIGDEAVNFKPGEMWLIDNSIEHCVVNNSADDRVVMIIDIRS